MSAVAARSLRASFGLVAALAVTTFSACAVAPTGSVDRGPPGLAGAQVPLLALSRYVLDNLATKTYAADPEYFDGSWVSGDSSCWMCSTGPGSDAAVLAGVPYPKSPYYRRLAERTFTVAIREHQRPDGSYINPAQPDQGTALPTIFFGVELGQAYLQLGSSLSPATRRLWRRALARMATYLVREQGLLHFYINGNDNLQLTELLFDAWRATGSRGLRSDYNASWRFTLHPGPRWPGFGLVITRPYRGGDASHGSGYLAESGGGAPGFDADYTELQANEDARLYVYSRDPRALRLLNLLANQLLSRRVDGWLLNTSGGTRHPAAHRYIPFTTSALAVLAWLGGRRDLLRDLPGQLNQERLTMCAGLTYSSANLYRALANESSVVLRAAELAGARARAGGLSSRPVCPNIPTALRRHLIP